MIEYDFFKSLLPLHEIRIEEKIKESGIDLDEFLDYSQVQLNRFVQFDMDLKNRTDIIMPMLDGSKTIADTKKIQSVIVRMINKRLNNKDKEDKELSHPQNALYHFYENIGLPADSPHKLKHTYNSFIAPGTAGERNRRCTGGAKRSLTTRLKDFTTIKALLSESGIQKLQVDEKAAVKDLQRFEK